MVLPGAELNQGLPIGTHLVLCDFCSFDVHLAHVEMLSHPVDLLITPGLGVAAPKQLFISLLEGVFLEDGLILFHEVTE